MVGMKSAPEKKDKSLPEKSKKNKDLLNIAIGALLAILGNFWITSLKEIDPSIQWGNPIILFATTVSFWGLIIIIIWGINFKQ